MSHSNSAEADYYTVIMLRGSLFATIRTMTTDVHDALAALAASRPLFHSEADFQHALSWQIHLNDPSAELRLEARSGRRTRLDLLARSRGSRIAVELKYPVRRFAGTVGDERFELLNHGAQDLSRYDIVKDITRIEALVAEGAADDGWVVALTNDPSFWKPGRQPDTIDAAFRLHEGRVLEGTRAWSTRASPGSTRTREASLTLQKHYTCAWRDYSLVQDDSGDDFQWRYLAINCRSVR